MSGFMPILHCFDYHVFVIYFEIRDYFHSSFVFLAQDKFSHLESFLFPYESKDCFSISLKNTIVF